MLSELLQDSLACYQALRTRDARFDGRFFVGVTSTGIYCRPVCRVRPPRPENCRFFGHAAQAEQAGFRPCLRCRPELAPRDRHWSYQDAGDRLIGHAIQWLDDPGNALADPDGQSPLTRLCRHLGVTDRHLRRLFAQHLGMTPLQYLQTRRLLTAKLLLTDTSVPIGQVATVSGFGSLRRFNDVFLQAYGLSPSRWRQPVHGAPIGRPGMRPARLAWRPPMNVVATVDFLSRRLLRSNEQRIGGSQPGFLKAVTLQHAGKRHVGWLRVRFAEPDGCVLLDVSPPLLPLLPQIIWRVRHWLDLDTDTGPIDDLLATDFPDGSGMRVPGCFDGFELAVRAILGQQVSLGAANVLAARLTERLGPTIVTPDASVNRLFPAPEDLARVAPSTLGELGIVRQRQTAMLALAQACDRGDLRLDPTIEPTGTVRQLESLPGIGPWTAQYIAMRALRWPDAWPPGDAALRRVLGVHNIGRTAAGNDNGHERSAGPLPSQLAPQPQGRRHTNSRSAGPLPSQLAPQPAGRIDSSERWRPWRSYAAMRAWAVLTPLSTKDAS